MKLFKFILASWAAIWIFFTIRGIVIEKDKSTFKDYVSLVCADEEGKRAIVYGKDLYKFLQFCKTRLPQAAAYEIVGIQKDSIDLPRLIYYLYPFVESSDSDFILVYKKQNFSKEGTYLYASLDKESFILKYK